MNFPAGGAQGWGSAAPWVPGRHPRILESPQDVTPGCPCCPCPRLAPVLALPTQHCPQAHPHARSSSFPLGSPLYFWKQFGQETHRKLSLALLPPQTFPSCCGRGQGRDFPLPAWGLEAAAKVSSGTGQCKTSPIPWHWEHEHRCSPGLRVRFAVSS